MNSELPRAERIAASCALVEQRFRDTRTLVSPALDDHLGLSLALKLEFENPLRSFKGRGACVFVQRELKAGEPLVTASAGNFGMAMACVATARNHRVTVFASVHANPVKLEMMRSFGAEVILAGEDFDAAKDEARGWAQARGIRFVEDGSEPAIAEGAGTMAVELEKQVRDLAVVFVPVGNGALLSGIGTWFRSVAPAVAVIGVVAAAAPCMMLSLREGRCVETEPANTIADGVAARKPVPYAVGSLDGVVDEVVAVSETEIVDAMRLLGETTGLQVEPAAALGVAAAARSRQRWRGARAATVLTGANLTDTQRRTWYPAMTRSSTQP